MKYEETIRIKQKRADIINRYLNTEPTCEKDCFGEDDSVCDTVRFQDGAEMDIKLCGVSYTEGESNLPWTEAVLFLHGSEAACTEPETEYIGTWELEANGNQYIAHVVPVE